MYKELVINDDPVGFWMLEDDSSDTLLDLSKYRLDGILTTPGSALVIPDVPPMPGPALIRSLTSTYNLADTCGVNSHFSFNPTTYHTGADGMGADPNPDALAAMIQMNTSVFRERIGPGNVQQQKAIDALYAGNGMRIYGFPGVLSDNETTVRNNIINMAKSSRAGKIAAFCGPNEVNGKNDAGNRIWGNDWATKTATFMSWVRDEVDKHTWPNGTPLVVGAVLKHNAVPLDDDIAELAAFNIEQYCDAGDFHFYSGGNGPGFRMNGKDANGNIPPGLTLDTDGKVAIEKFELYRHLQVYNDTTFPMCHSEWGWPTTQNPPGDDRAAILAQETYLRDYNLGITYSIIYEAINERASWYDSNKNSDEANFGQVDVHQNPHKKPAFFSIQKILTYQGTEDFDDVGWLVDIGGVVSDAGVNVFSIGSGKWDVYFTRNAQNTVHMVLESGYSLVGFDLDPGGYYVVPLADTLTVVNVIPDANPPVWQQSNPPDGTKSVSYGSYNFVATGNPVYTLEPGSGALPTGLTLDSNGTLHGTPTVEGLYNFKIRAENAAGHTISPALDIAIFAAPAFITATPPPGAVAAAYSYLFTASGYPNSVFTVVSGSLPPGLTLTTGGLLSGSPTTSSTYHFAVQASNGIGSPAVTASLTLIILAGSGGTLTAPIFINQSPPLTATVGDFYDYVFTASGNPAPTFSETGTLPTNLTMAAGGQLSGILTQSGTFNFTVTATNSQGSVTTGTFTLVVDENLIPPQFIAKNPPDGTRGVSYNYPFVATGTPPLVFSTTDTLPAGLTLSSSGVLSGTPTVSGKFSFSVLVTNDVGTDSTGVLTIKLFEAPAFVAASPPGGAVGDAYSYRFTVTAYPNADITVLSGTLPTSLQLNKNGRLSGTPTVAGTYMFVVQADNGVGSPAVTGTLTVVIGSGGGGSPTAPVFVLFNPPNAIVGDVYDYAFTATGNPDPTFSLGNGSLPIGLILTSDGHLSGSPTAAGTYVFTILATNSTGTAETPDITIIIRHGGGGGAGDLHELFPLIESVDHAIRFDDTVMAALPIGTPLYTQGAEFKSFTLEAWVLFVPKPSGSPSDQVILGSNNSVDGLIINDRTISFVVQFANTPNVIASYEAPTHKKMHVVGTFEQTRIRLYINGENVDTVELSDDQISDEFLPGDDNLYAGFNAGGQSIGLNGIAVYDHVLSYDQVVNHYRAGLATNPAETVASVGGGTWIEADRTVADIGFTHTWQTYDDWQTGYMIDCLADIDNDILYPEQNADTGLTLPGIWRNSFLLEPPDSTTIFGVVIDWEGTGITVSLSFDGVTWIEVASGLRTSIIADGHNAVDKDLFIQVQFDAGMEIDKTYLNRISATIFQTGTLATDTRRAISLAGPVTINNKFEAFETRDDSGLRFSGGVLTITDDGDTDIPAVQTIELWVKLLDAHDLIINVGGVRFDDPTNGKQYKNGVAGPAQPDPGEWTVVHMVLDTSTTSDITIQHVNLVIANIVLYSEALSAVEIKSIYDDYVGIQASVVDDESTISITVPSDEATIYNHDWSITGAG